MRAALATFRRRLREWGTIRVRVLVLAAVIAGALAGCVLLLWLTMRRVAHIDQVVLHARAIVTAVEEFDLLSSEFLLAGRQRARQQIDHINRHLAELLRDPRFQPSTTLDELTNEHHRTLRLLADLDAALATPLGDDAEIAHALVLRPRVVHVVEQMGVSSREQLQLGRASCRERV